ncbi:hypothetical protein RN001_001355 [Aquatica leii]|uniref:Uncharacterized protein n=1 Tax=Aquatica leii TaxID=1421715 RepID=A0AAN7PFX0_9COLE|nr:hypothetical protein RN001_001355 [Aquatica leii]
MPVNSKELVNFAVDLSKSEDLKVTVVESCKGACIAGGGALVGALLGGPIGLALGGTVGSVYAAVNGRGKFKSVASVILEMSPQQREALANSLKNAFKDVQLEDGVMLFKLVMANDALKLLAIQELVKFMKNEMGLNIVL